MQVEHAPRCPDEGDLARFVEHALAEDDAERLRDHLDDCDTCRQGVMAWVQGSPTIARTERSRPGRPLDAANRLELGHFRLERRLGAGGMGIVYAALDTRLERQVAIKLLASSSAADADRLLAEARAQARITHPNVLTVYEVGETDGVVYIAMELIRGRTLRAHLARRRLDPEAVIALYARAAAGLAAAHAQGVIHRDFKPDNVLVEEDPLTGAARRTLVADFGLAELVADETDRTTARCGTPAYMAPEQHRGEPVDVRADVFGFAVALWESLYGVLPYPERSIDGAVPPAAPARPVVPAHVRDLLQQALAIDRARRPASMAEVVAALSPRPRGRRTPLLALAAAGFALGGAAASSARGSTPVAAEACTASLDAWQPGWSERATAAGVPAWVRARVIASMTTRAHEVMTRGAAVCGSVDAAARRAWIHCRGEQAIIERETLAALARPWPSYARLDDALTLPWVSTCATKAAALDLVLAPTTPADRATVADARATLARIELAWHAGQPRETWDADLARLADRELSPAVRTAIASERRLLEVDLAATRDGRQRMPMLEAAVAEAERTGDLVGAARAWLSLARLQRATGVDATRAFEQADWAIERVGDPPALRAPWHAGMTNLAWARSDLHAARAHARAAAALETAGGSPRRYTLLALASAAGANAAFREQRRALEEMLEDPELGGVHHDAIGTWRMYAETLYQLGELDPAMRAIERALALATQLNLEEDPLFAQALLVRSFIELDLARPDDCLATVARAEQLLARVAGPDDHKIGAALNIRSSAHAAKRDWRRALAAAEAAAAFFARTEGTRSIASLFARSQVGEFAKHCGELARAETVLRAVVADAHVVFGPDDERTAAAEQKLGDLLFALGRVREARPLLEHAVATNETLDVAPKYAAQAMVSLAAVLLPSSVAAERARGRSLARAAQQAWRGDPYWAEELAKVERLLGRSARQP